MNNEEKNIEEQGAAPESAPKTSWWAKLATGVKAGIIAAAALVVIVPIVLVLVLGGNGNDGGNNGGDNGGSNGGAAEISYSVTVKDNDGAPVSGVKVAFILKNGTALNATTDANGKATPVTNKNIASVKITYVPEEYEAYSKLNVSQNFAEDGSLSVTLTKLPPYIVKIVDQNDDAVVGASVMICVSGNEGMCVPMPTTDANGESSIIVQPNTYMAKIATLPEGYTVDDISKYYEMDGYTVTIIVTKTAE